MSFKTLGQNGTLIHIGDFPNAPQSDLDSDIFKRSSNKQNIKEKSFNISDDDPMLKLKSQRKWKRSISNNKKRSINGGIIDEERAHKRIKRSGPASFNRGETQSALYDPSAVEYLSIDGNYHPGFSNYLVGNNYLNKKINVRYHNMHQNNEPPSDIGVDRREMLNENINVTENNLRRINKTHQINTSNDSGGNSRKTAMPPQGTLESRGDNIQAANDIPIFTRSMAADIPPLTHSMAVYANAMHAKSYLVETAHRKETATVDYLNVNSKRAYIHERFQAENSVMNSNKTFKLSDQQTSNNTNFKRKKPKKYASSFKKHEYDIQNNPYNTQQYRRMTNTDNSPQNGKITDTKIQNTPFLHGKITNTKIQNAPFLHGKITDTKIQNTPFFHGKITDTKIQNSPFLHGKITDTKIQNTPFLHGKITDTKIQNTPFLLRSGKRRINVNQLEYSIQKLNSVLGNQNQPKLPKKNYVNSHPPNSSILDTKRRIERANKLRHKRFSRLDKNRVVGNYNAMTSHMNVFHGKESSKVRLSNTSNIAINSLQTDKSNSLRGETVQPEVLNDNHTNDLLLRKTRNPSVPPQNMHTRVHTRSVHPQSEHTRGIHPQKVHTHGVHTRNVHPQSVHPQKVHTHGVDTRNVHPQSVHSVHAAPQPSYLTVGLVSGHLRMSLRAPDGTVVDRTLAGPSLTDGDWHRLHIRISEKVN